MSATVGELVDRYAAAEAGRFRLRTDPGGVR